MKFMMSSCYGREGSVGRPRGRWVTTRGGGRRPGEGGGRRPAGWSVDRREVGDGVVDAVEDVGEHDDRDREADLDELLVSVAGRPDRDELGLADRAAGAGEQLHEMDQRVALGIAGRLAGADRLQRILRKAGHLAE